VTLKNILKFLACPYCQHRLILKNQQLLCNSCLQSFPIIKGVPILLKENRLNRQEAEQLKKFNRYFSLYPLTYKLENWQQSMLKRIFVHDFTKKVKLYLDVGCGSIGYTAIEAAKRNHWLSFGIDISLEAVLKAKILAKKEGVENKTAFLVCSAENLPFKKNTFNYISAVSVFEHLANDQNSLNNASRILKNNGFLYICVPNSYKNIWPFLWPFYWRADYKMGHQRHYSLQDLNKKLKLCDFQLKKFFYNGHLIKLIQLLLERLKLIKKGQWWQWEKKDINLNPKALQLNAIYQKN